MKKFFLLATIACLAFASCEDVPAPYELFDPNSGNGQGGDTESALPYTNSNLSDWKAVTVKGAAWSLGNTYAKATGYNSADKTTSETEAWLVSPAISTKTDAAAAHIELEHVIRYVNASSAPLSNHTMWITTEFTDDVTTTKWTQLAYKPVESATQTWEFYEANQIAVPSEFLNQTVYVALKFVCGSSSTTWEVKNFNIKVGEAVDGGDTPGTPDVPQTGAGSKSEPYNVASAQTASGNAWVKGYIVGYVDGQTYATGATFAVPSAAETEILIADAADCADATKCIPIQLPAGDIRNGLELSAHPDLLKKEVMLYGSIENYFGVKGLKSTSCAIIDGKTIGKDPEDATSTVVPGTPSGEGTEASPYNICKALTLIANNQMATTEVYIKGKICSIKEVDTGTYGNATYNLSDDGTATENGELTVYRGYYLEGAKFTDAAQIKVGDEVVVYGKLTLYGSTPEVAQGSKISSLNGEGGNGDNGGNGGDPTPSGDYISLDFTSNDWQLPAANAKGKEEATFSNGSYSVTLYGTSDAGYGYGTFEGNSYLIFGKQGAYLTFQAFDFAVAKIETDGNSGASANTELNLYVGDEAVSTKTKGCQGTNTYEIAPAYQAAGNQYTLKVLSKHNAQITKVRIYKAK